MLEKNQNTILSHVLFSLIFLVAALLVVFLTDPFESIWFVILFFAALAGFCMNFFAVVFEGWIYKNRGQHPAIAVRQSVLLTIGVVGLMFLSSQQLLHWWVGGIFIALLVLIEGFFLVS